MSVDDDFGLSHWLLTRADAQPLFPRLQLADLHEANHLTPGADLLLCRAVRDRGVLFQVRLQRHALGVYVGCTPEGREVRFHAAHVLRVIRRPT